MSRPQPVASFGGPLQRVLDVLHALFGKVVSLSDVALLLDTAGVTVTNAASGSGTALTATRAAIDFADAGVDNVRLVVRGQNSAAGDVTVQAYNVSASAVIASATITGTSEQSAESDWVRLAPAGGDEEVEIRVVGDGAADPVLYSAHLQLRTLQARA